MLQTLRYFSLSRINAPIADKSATRTSLSAAKPFRFLPGLALMVGAAGLLIPTSAHADVTISAASASSLPTTTGAGLSASYYKTSVTFTSGSDATIYATANTPTATFISSSPSYINPIAGNNSYADTLTTLQTFLGSDYDPSNPGLVAARNNNLSNQLFTFNGYLKITAPENVIFTLGADDGAVLTIGGVSVIDRGTPKTYASLTNTADFSVAGLYAINLVYFENTGFTGVSLTSNLNGSGTLNGTTQSVISSGLLYPAGTAAPEPASYAAFVLGGLGLLGLGLKARQRRLAA